MKKELEALKEIQNNYDAFYIANKYGDNGTHEKEFNILKEFIKNDIYGKRALNWIRHEYDCYYLKDFIGTKGTAFAYLEELIESNN